MDRENHSGKLFAAPLSEKDFQRLSRFIHSSFGIKMPESKKIMLQARLQKRLRSLGMNSFEDYCEFLFSPKGTEEELHNMINVVTTNKTDFFREPVHFSFLVGLLRDPRLSPCKRDILSVWSAGCSTGEEPYTIAMVLSDFAENNPGQALEFSILGTDISTIVLEKAAAGIYDEGRAEQVPAPFKKKYLLRSRDRNMKKIRIVPQIRSLVRFRRLNFMDEDFGIGEMDVIFCRNVIIYFDKNTQARLLERICGYLAPGGYLFMGHSETLHGFDLPLLPVAPSVYRKAD